MFFIAFFIVPKVSVIIPKSWVHEIDQNWEKFVNNSINRNQQFLCYFSKQPNAVDASGAPNIDFAPDFTLALNGTFPADGCYTANLYYYKGWCFLNFLLLVRIQFEYILKTKSIL